MGGALDDRWLVWLRPQPRGSLRLFCLPYAGGGASVFRLWADLLPPGVELCSVQLPGRETRIRERPFDRLSDLTPAVAQVLLPHLGQPYALFGHSMGALIAFEVARFLRDLGARLPLVLFASGHAAPHLPSRHPRIHHLPQAEFLRELRRYKGTPEAILASDEALGLFLPVLRADFALFETYEYHPEPPLELPISALGGLTDDEVRPPELEAWVEQTSAGFRERLFEGGHFFVNSARAEVMRAVGEDLRLALAAPSLR